MKTLIAVVILAAVPARAAELTPAEQKAMFFYDLGPDEADVSGYPARQRENYAVFKNACSQCHTLARPLNSPVIGRKHWEYYVFRMRAKAAETPGVALSAEEVDRVLDFLSYDSRVRKVKGRKAFQARSKKLQKRFDQVVAERLKRMKDGKE